MMRNNPLFSWLFISSILLGVAAVVSAGVCLGSQQSWLLQLKSSLDFSRSISKLDSWNESSDCCSWEGVSCDQEGRVTRLDLSGKSISGGLDNSSTLFNLQHLKSLDLSSNYFNSTIPSRIGTLTNLSHLNLASAGFVGQVPIDISRLRSLVTLELSSREEPLEIPSLSMLVQNLSALQELRLGGVNLSLCGKEYRCQPLSSLVPELRILSLAGCNLSGPFDQWLGERQSLSVIELADTNLSSPVPASFGKFPNLTSLHLRNCGLEGTFPSTIFQVPTLQIIDISSNEFLQGTLPEFPANNALQELNLSSTKFAGSLPTSLGNIRNLSILDLSTCQFNGILPSSMSNLTQVSRIDLSNNSFSGSIPSFLFALPFLGTISLSKNNFSGPILEFETTSSSKLDSLDLSHNNLEGLLPTSIFKLKNLASLDLSFNKFNGTKPRHMFEGLTQLVYLDLSYNGGTTKYEDSGGDYSSLVSPSSGIRELRFSSCNLKSFPDYLKNLSSLNILDLSNNQISGEIPKWIWEVGNGSLRSVNLSRNYLVGIQEPFSFPESLESLDLHLNKLRGNIPVLPPKLHYVDLSSNNFTFLPTNTFDGLQLISLISLSNNSLTGVIPENICIPQGRVLDLSHNNLSGRIPKCLIESMMFLYGVLNLRNNKLEGPIPDAFPAHCSLKALDLNGNLIEGEVPKSLVNCFELEVLDLGNNQLIGKFPCFLRNISTLQVLILRSNKFHGTVECSNTNESWSMLQIFDLANNSFSGKLPGHWFASLQAIMSNAQAKVLGFVTEVLGVVFPQAEAVTVVQAKGAAITQKVTNYELPPIYYRYTVTVTMKGQEMKLTKILTIFTSIDLSSNKFHGPIPAELGQLHALHFLNLSANVLNGEIPPAIGNIRQMESLDLSRNNLSGRIPTSLQSLNFLSFLNLSFNQLVGSVPTGSQIQTFSEDSFMGNLGLCGFPLTKNCSNKEAPTATKEKSHSNSQTKIDWNLLSVEIGFIVGFATVVMPLFFFRRWRMAYYERADDIILNIFPIAVARKWFLWTTT